MRVSRIFFVAFLTAAIFTSGCEKKNSVEGAIDDVQDALNVREHEKLKDAGEDIQDAVNDAADEVKDATN